jgi:glycosyltransferase involved in cell wall biosynthesis
VRRAARRLREFTARVQPDLVHAMRIPYEGMVAADAYAGVPLLVSTWGNDFTLHARSTRLMSHYTRWTMQVADALHSDCRRDVRLAKQWGFRPERPVLVAPGNGGVQAGVFFSPATPVAEPVIINPRGFRPYVRNDVFFQAIPLVLAKQPGAKFLFASMAGASQAEQWIQELQIAQAVELLPSLPHTKMADAFRRAQIVASPAIHDGTPNSLLEGMACGCFPVAGDLESIREWITHRENGLLFDPTSPRAIADSILSAIEDKRLRQSAAGLNRELIAAHAEYERTMQRAEEFYEKLIGSSGTHSRL